MFRRLVRWLKASVAIAVIGMALMVGGLALALPWIESHPDDVRAFLSKVLDREVGFTAMRAQWRRQGPLFELDNVTLRDPQVGGDPFRIAHAALSVDVYAWAKHGVSVIEFRIDGVELDVERKRDGEWKVARLTGGGDEDNGSADTVLRLGAVVLSGAKVHLADEVSGRDLRLDRVDLRILNDGRKHRFGALLHLADNTPPVAVACESHDQRGKCYVSGRGMEPHRWIGAAPFNGIHALAGTLTGEAWVDWSPDGIDLRVESQGDGLVLAGAEPVTFSDGDRIEPRAYIPTCRVSMAARRGADGDWSGDLMEWRNPDRSGEPAVALHVDLDAEGKSWKVSAPRLAIDALAPLAALVPELPPSLRLFLFESAPHGAIRNLLAERGGRDLIEADLEGLAFRPGLKSPGLSGLSGRLLGDAEALVFSPSAGSELVFDYRRTFRQPIRARWKAGDLALVNAGNGARIEATGLDLDGGAFAVQGRASLWFDPDREQPTLDASLDLQAGDVNVAKQFWPLNVMSERIRNWLDRGLVSGSIPEAHAIFHGDLDDWPFKGNEGRFEAWTKLANVDLNFNPSWPHAHLIDATADFVDNGMSVALDEATLLDNRIEQSSAKIDDFHDASLTLAVHGSGAGDRMLDVLRQSSLHARLSRYIDDLHIGGRLAVDVNLGIPLRQNGGDTTVDGRGTLTDADLSMERYKLLFEKANGDLRFNERGFGADSLSGSFRGEPTKLTLASGPFVTGGGKEFEAKFTGQYTPNEIFGDVLPESWSSALTGKSSWDVVVSSVAGATDGASRQTVALSSDLVGTAMDLPAPLNKAAAARWGTTVRFDLPLSAARGSLVLDDLLRADLKLPAAGETLRAAIAFGNATIPELPAAGMRIRGVAPTLDLAGFASMKGGSGGGPIDADLGVGQLEVMGKRFADTRVRLVSNGDTHLELDGAALAGSIDLPGGVDVARGVTAKFSRLTFPEAPPTAPGKAPVVEKSGIDPALLPVLHVQVDELVLGKARFGATRIETFPIAHGLRVDNFSSRSPDFSLDAKGDWTLVDGHESSAFRIDVSAENLGHMLSAFGYAGIVDGGPTLAGVDGSWAGAPGAFALPLIDGKLTARIGKGRVLEVDPGAGRLFGLFSIQALPRRLSLDFSDFFKTGLAFDQIDATFDLQHGNAFTADLELKGPAADISVRGRTGLAARDYDQDIEVTPRTGSVLPVVGALTGGPIGAAAGLVLGSVMPQTGRAKYKVTGSWDKPNVALVAKEKTPPSGTTAPPPAQKG